MLITAHFVERLSSLGIEIQLEGDRIRVNAPIETLTAEIREQLAAQKEELRIYLLSQEQTSSESARPTASLRRPQQLPLSFSQRRFWFLSELEPEQAVYHIPTVIRLEGNLDIPKLERSLQAIIERHETLRTTFVIDDGIPWQRILSKPDFKLALEDLTHLPDEEQGANALLLAAEETSRPFDLAQDLMLRARLLKLAESEFILIITIHHIASDGWSTGIFRQELSALYKSFVNGKPASLAELPIQYVDYAIWQRKWLRGDKLEQQLAYWRPQLADLVPLELPTDRPRPPIQSHRGAAHRFLLPDDLLSRLQALSRHEGATLFMTLLAAFKMLLQRYTRENDIAVGTIIANRHFVEIEGLIGLFINTLVMRTDLSGEPTFRELLGRVRRIALDAFDHQDTPFEKLLEEIQPHRDLSQAPLIQVLLVLQNMPLKELELPDVTIRPMKLPRRTSKLDLSLYLRETRDGFLGIFEYNSDLFNASTIERMAGHFYTLLQGIVTNPDLPISQVPWLTAGERSLLLQNWNHTAADFAELPSIAAQFYTQAAQNPAAPAFIANGESITFAELNERSNQLAHYLLNQGIQPGTRIGLALERSLPVPVALLAIFKVGGVYVPLDPAYPAERLRFILQDSDVHFLLTSSRWEEIFAPGAAAAQHLLKILYLDSYAADRSDESSANLPFQAEPAQTAYIIYTSGSTGRPKGAAVPHRQILNRLAWMWEEYPFLPDEVGCQKTSLNFVDSLWELFGYLLKGVPTVIIPDEFVKDPRLLVDNLSEQNVTRLWLVPSLLQAILQTHPDLQHRLPRLTFWVSSGEALSTDLARQFREAVPHAVLYNLYGTSEVWDVTWYDPAKEIAPENEAAVPIGRPISNMHAYILDSEKNLLPVGVPGELVVGGHGLAHGYVNLPELSRQRFIANPFNAEPGTSLYLTGDLACWLPDGSIRLIGRLDRQIKIRGFRVEPGEIETILRRLEDIDDAAVVVQGEEIDRKLVAYVLLAKGFKARADTWRSFLSEYLPNALIPAPIVVLDAFPLTPSGKLDRQALASLDLGHSAKTAELSPPVTKVESQMAAIWREVLGQDQIQVHDNFFDLGGHSLLGVRLFARIEKEFGVRLSMDLLFRAPTIAQLVDYLQQPGSMQESQTLVPIQSMGTRPPFFCVHGFGGGVLDYADLAHLLGAGQPFYGLKAAGIDDNEPADETIEAMAERYIVAMRGVQPAGPYHIGGYCFGGVVAFEIARQLQVQGESGTRVAIFEGFAPRQYHARTPIYHPNRLLTFWRSVPYWTKDYWSLGGARLSRRARAKAKAGWKRLQKSLGLQREIQLSDIIDTDISIIPDRHQQLLHTHLGALSRYSPQPIDGSVTLFRAQWQTVSKVLFGALDPQYGWDRLARGGVEIRPVDSSHRNILMKPQVASLTTQLADFLESDDN